MKPKYTIAYLEEAIEFLESLPAKVKDKVANNISKAADHDDRELFKKVDGDIWEFRTLSQNLHIRLFAFWDKRNNKDTLVVATHGIVKKKSKLDKRDIDKAGKIRNKYFSNENG